MIKNVYAGPYEMYDIIHFIPSWQLSGSNIESELIIDNEIELMKEEMEENFPYFQVNCAYPQRKYMKSDKDYEKAIHTFEHNDAMGDVLKVMLTIVKARTNY